MSTAKKSSLQKRWAYNAEDLKWAIEWESTINPGRWVIPEYYPANTLEQAVEWLVKLRDVYPQRQYRLHNRITNEIIPGEALV